MAAGLVIPEQPGSDAICRCGKLRFASRKAAKRHARAFAAARRGKIRVYRCGGGFWHMTSESTRKTTLRREDRARITPTAGRKQ